MGGYNTGIHRKKTSLLGTKHSESFKTQVNRTLEEPAKN